MSNRSSVGRSGRLTDSPNRLLGTVFGVVYLLVGLLGFAYTGFSTSPGRTPTTRSSASSRSTRCTTSRTC